MNRQMWRLFRPSISLPRNKSPSGNLAVARAPGTLQGSRIGNKCHREPREMKRPVLLANALLIMAMAAPSSGFGPPAADGAGERAAPIPADQSKVAPKYLTSLTRSLSKCWCPDDYCPKPCPSFCLPPICGCRDSYCPKPAPCVSMPPVRGCPDDYCPKPPPCVSWPCRWPDFYKCPPPRCGRSDVNRNRTSTSR